MTVKELIKQLELFAPELEVYIEDWNEEYAAPALLGKATLIQKKTTFSHNNLVERRPIIVLTV
jgi:hypothetical protein